MEKKGIRSVQPSAKGLTTDSKKSQDVASGKLWPRGGRRREPVGGSLAAKSEPFRKPNPQRTVKTFDAKKPRARGAGNASSSMGRAETTRLEEYEAEFGSVFVPGSKKQSLNHLLRFNFVNPLHMGHGHSDRRSVNKTANRLMPTRKHKYNKEHFLQANCQFVVNSMGDYKQYMNNPDALVDWNLIEQVNVKVSEFSSCPICLFPPAAAKMTRCGHIYCWSCLLHYLSLSDKPCRNCPICDGPVYIKDLKSVISIPLNTFNVDDVITFKLMKRPRGSLIAYPASAVIADDEVLFHISEKYADDVDSKLLLADHSEILSIIEREEMELNAKLLEDEGCPENCFVQQALVLLSERKNKLFEELDLHKHSPRNKPGNCSLKDENLNLSLEGLEIHSEEELDEAMTVNPESLDIPADTNQQSQKMHYFYQASDGQHLFLHAINARMLEHTYGSLDKSPNILSGKILEKEGGSMTEELRKRFRYLQHLPVTCQFEIAEIHLKQPIVKKDTLQHFHDQIEIRRKSRQRRAKEEKKREKRIAEEENRQMGKYPVPNLHIESQLQFPCFESTTQRCESECQPSDASSTDGLTSPSGSLTVENEYAGPSFAKMLANPKKPINKWPALKETPSPVKLINVTGQKIQQKSFAGHRSDSDHEIEDYEPLPPSNNRSIGDAIAQALQKVEETDVSSDSPLTGKKKRKKNKQKVLFTTNVAYSGK